MRILKNKIAHARRCKELQYQKSKIHIPKNRTTVHPPEEQSKDLSCSKSLNDNVKTNSRKPNKPQSSNNIIKNYSRALINFALSEVAEPYVSLGIQEHNVTKAYYDRFIRKDKQKMNCIQSLRNKLLIFPDDTENISRCKKVFQSVCVAFLKYFSVNWIYSSKVNDKLTHLKYRFKILRRVQDPQYFTYLKEFKKKQLQSADK